MFTHRDGLFYVVDIVMDFLYVCIDCYFGGVDMCYVIDKVVSYIFFFKQKTAYEV